MHNAVSAGITKDGILPENLDFKEEPKLSMIKLQDNIIIMQ